MTALTAEPRHPGARGVPRTAAFRVELVRDWKQAIARCNDVRSSTLFQDTRWLDAWYKAFAHVAHVEPLIAVISDALTSERVALLPLVRRLQNGVRIVEFADLALTDYNAPMLGPAAPRDAGRLVRCGAISWLRCGGCLAVPISFACARCRPISTACPIR